MKKVFYSFAALVALVLGAGCQQDIVPVTDEVTEQGSITIGVDGLITTRAAVTTTNDWETQLNKVEVLVFDSTGELATYHEFSSSEITAKKATTDKIKKGNYTVYVVCNGGSLSLSNFNGKLSDLKQKEITLDTYNSRTAANGMIMTGSNTCNVTKDAEACAVTVYRHVARVVLKKITNNAVAAKGAITPKAVFLSNVNKKEYIDSTFTAVTTDFVNQYGRSSAYTKVAKIEGSTYAATYPGLTYQALSGTVAAAGGTKDFGYTYGVYSYANSNADKNDLDLSGTFPAYAVAGCRLVLLATFDGTDYYYPVAIPNVAANKTYDVEIAISGKGLDDPQGNTGDLAKGSIEVTITVADWVSGGELSGDY